MGEVWVEKKSSDWEGNYGARKEEIWGLKWRAQKTMAEINASKKV